MGVAMSTIWAAKAQLGHSVGCLHRKVCRTAHPFDCR